MGENRFDLRAAACSMHCSASRTDADSFYLNGKLPGAYLADNTQTEISPVMQEGFFAVFSGLNTLDKVKIKALDEFRTSIINSGTAAVNACYETLSETLQSSCNYSFAMVKLKDDIAQIYYKGDCSVYIYRNNKVISLTDVRIDKSAEKKTDDDSNSVSFTPEFKLIKNDALILCTGGVKEKLHEKILAHILGNTKGCKAAAQSITLSANENHCVNDATALVIRVLEKKEDEKSASVKTDFDTIAAESADIGATKTFDGSFVTALKSDESEKTSKKTLYADYDEYDSDSEFEESGGFNLSTAAWCVIGVLTAALGVIAGLIVLVYI